MPTQFSSAIPALYQKDLERLAVKAPPFYKRAFTTIIGFNWNNNSMYQTLQIQESFTATFDAVIYKAPVVMAFKYGLTAAMTYMFGWLSPSASTNNVPSLMERVDRVLATLEVNPITQVIEEFKDVGFEPLKRIADEVVDRVEAAAPAVAQEVGQAVYRETGGDLTWIAVPLLGAVTLYMLR